jgi:hypothetical protein
VARAACAVVLRAAVREHLIQTSVRGGVARGCARTPHPDGGRVTNKIRGQWWYFRTGFD